MDVNKVLKTAVHQYFCNFEGKSWTPPTPPGSALALVHVLFFSGVSGHTISVNKTRET